MRSYRVVLPLPVRCCYFPRTDGADPKVWIYFVVQYLQVNRVICHRIYAVTMKNIPVTSVFAVITATQLALGIWAVVLTSHGRKAKHFDLKSCPHFWATE